MIVCSYEFVEANVSKKHRFVEDIARWREAGNRNAPKPKRPTCALATQLWSDVGLPFKRGYMDEAHVVNKREGKRHQALQQLHVASWCVMSGTLAHNRWHDLSGYLDFVKGHPYDTHAKFNKQFSVTGYTNMASRELGGPQMALLQRFLQALLIMRPANILTLPPCARVAWPVTLDNATAYCISKMTETYKRACGMEKDFASGARPDLDSVSPLGAAVRAQLFSLHPRLLPETSDGEDEDFHIDNEDLMNTTAEILNDKFRKEDPKASEKRRRWLADLHEWTDEMLFDSPHVQHMVDLIQFMVRSYPEEKIVIMSQYLKYLDVIAVALDRRYNISCLRYDGTVSQAHRITVQEKFADKSKGRPLLITVGAGSVGLNLTSGRIVILAEQWWNASVEAQSISRVWRQGATEIVTVIKFHVVNSAIDQEIARVQRLKQRTNVALMSPLIHKHDEVPDIIPLLY